MVCGPGAHHEGIDHGTQNGLQQQQHGSYWTLVGDDAVAVANSGFCLDGEEEGRDEAINIIDTRRPVVIPQMVQVPPLGRKKAFKEWRVGEAVGEKSDRGGCSHSQCLSYHI